ncbi:copper-transporting ATPase HMA5 isoform X5 [Capsicum annuum]|uniref:copper-transporting ATPase HMA5 isoform X5 n=1 Tax=Capsicum annuum TaxID=4072 RepID=UPI001FB141B0|nr:copper-transporting ATPase HMA5 isoform X5 [Capsicum annuum]
MIRESKEDVGFQAKLIEEEMNQEKSSQVCRIQVHGMTCTSCSTTLESALQVIPGVQEARVALATQEAEICYDPKIVDCNQLLEAIANTGFEGILISTGEDSSRILLKVDGVNTENCVTLIKSSLLALKGVQEIDFDLQLKKISVSYTADVTGPRDFIRAIESTGSGCFKASIFPEGRERGEHRHQEIKQYHRAFLWSLVFAVPVFFTSMVFMYIPGLKDVLETKVANMLTVGQVLRWGLSTPVQFIIGRRFYVGAYIALSHGYANMDVLIALGTNAAYFYSVYSVIRAATSPTFKASDFFETSSMLISFILLGKYLEVLARGKTSEAIAKLMDLAPKTATLLTLDDKGNVVNEEEVDSRLIQKNDVIKTIPGSKVACDGLVIWGQSHANESMITGESRPVTKKPGDMVIGGTMNENGVLHIKATRIGSETALSQIVRLVESAQMAKAPVQRFADHISKYFVPLVIALSFCTWVSWFLAGIFTSYPRAWIPSSMDSFELALQFGISVMVIACPCALGLATPTAVMVGTGVGASLGVLIKGGQALESAQEVNSDHPLAKAIVEYAKKLRGSEENLAWPEASNFESITGHGVRAIICNKEVILGNKSLMLEHGIAIPVQAEEALAEAEGQAQTGILVSIDKELIGVLSVSDPLKPEAPAVISFLKSMNVESMIVTGDNWGTANAIAKQVGIDGKYVVAEAKPEQKAEKVKELQYTGFRQSCGNGRRWS